MKRVPFFPLPGTVLFPRVRMPLHLFEARYRQMAADAIAGERLLAVVLLKPGWEKDYYGNPPVHETATVGFIEQYERLPDGRYDIVLHGFERCRLLAPDAEVPTPGKLYRSSWTVPAPEKNPPPGFEFEPEGRLRLTSLWRQLIEESGAREELWQTVRAEAPYEVLVNQVATFAGLPPETKQSLLEEDHLLERARALESALQEQILYWIALRRFRDLVPRDTRLN